MHGEKSHNDGLESPFRKGYELILYSYRLRKQLKTRFNHTHAMQTKVIEMGTGCPTLENDGQCQTAIVNIPSMMEHNQTAVGA